MSDAIPDDPGSLTPKERRDLTRMPNDRAISAVLASAGILASFMQTIVTPVIPHLPELLHTTRGDATWVITATMLAATISIPIAGRLGDMFGKRRLHLVLLGILVVGSIVSALSPTIVPMIVGRAMQGIGLGVISLGVSILRDTMHPKRLAGAIGLVSASLGIGGSLGLPLAAWVAATFDFHALFFVTAALGTLLMVAVVRIVPVSTLRSGGRFDFVGAVGLAIGLVGILLGVTKGSEWGWASPLTLGLFAGGVAVLVVWGWFELRTTGPLVDLRITARRPVLLTNLASISIGFGYFVTISTLPLVLESPVDSDVGLGLPLLGAALCLMPIGLVMFSMAPLSARLSNARGPRTTLIIGASSVTTGLLIAIFLLGEIWHVILIGAVIGGGVGLAYASMPTLIMRAVPPSETAAANGLNAVMRTLGGTVGAALVGVMLTNYADADGIPTAMAFHVIFIMAVLVTISGVVLAVLIPRREIGYETASIPQPPK